MQKSVAASTLRESKEVGKSEPRLCQSPILSCLPGDGLPPAFILSREVGISLDKGPEVTENKKCSARDQQIGVEPTVPRQYYAAALCALLAARVSLSYNLAKCSMSMRWMKM